MAKEECQPAGSEGVAAGTAQYSRASRVKQQNGRYVPRSSERKGKRSGRQDHACLGQKNVGGIGMGQ